MHKKTASPAHSTLTPATEQKTAPGSVSRVLTLKGKVSEDTVRLSAYQKWENAGRPSGDGVKFWLEAEQEQSKVN